MISQLNIAAEQNAQAHTIINAKTGYVPYS